MKKVFIIGAILLLSLFATAAQAQAAQHGIKLTWVQGTSSGVVFNTVYQGPHNGPYTVIFTSTAPITTFLVPMTTANQGTTACFVVTDTVIIESLFSNETCGTFPVQPLPPTSLSNTSQ